MSTTFSSRLRLGAACAGALAALCLSPDPSVFAQSGTQQSPIDIRAEEVATEHLSRMRFAYGRHVSVSMVNTGSPDENATVRADVPADAAHLVLDSVTYTLLQFHWHTPSEHRIDGEAFPLEMHFVHRAEDGTLAVVGVLIQEGEENVALGKLFSRFPQAPSERIEVSDVDLRRLLPRVASGKRRSYRYPGSLTTPPFTEGVQWTVLAKPIQMSAAQFDSFRVLFPEHNSRDVQPLDGRAVTTDVRRH